MTALSTTLTDTLEKAGIGQELMKALEAEFRKMRIPTGFITGWRGKTPPEGWLAVNGQEVYQSVYPELYAFLKAQPNARTGTDGIGPYVHCDMPHHRVIELTTNPNEVGQLVEAGLPDISGSFGNLIARKEEADRGEMGAADGAFTTKPSEGGYGVITYCTSTGDNTSHRSDGIGFKASRSNALFGKSPTNQMASLRCLAIIKW